MSKVLSMLVAGMFVMGTVHFAFADVDHGQYKKSVVNEKLDEKLEASKAKMQSVMMEYIDTKSTDGVLELKDPKSGDMRKLTFMDLHRNVGMKNGKHYSCADFKDNDTGEFVDVDIYVDADEDGFTATDALIHKVDGDPVDGSDSEAKGSDAMKGSGY